MGHLRVRGLALACIRRFSRRNARARAPRRQMHARCRRLVHFKARAKARVPAEQPPKTRPAEHHREVRVASSFPCKRANDPVASTRPFPKDGSRFLATSQTPSQGDQHGPFSLLSPLHGSAPSVVVHAVAQGGLRRQPGKLAFWLEVQSRVLRAEPSATSADLVVEERRSACSPRPCRRRDRPR